MKKLILSMLMGMIMLGAVAQDGKFTVKGTFEEFGDSVFFKILSTSNGKSFPVTGR